ncbi:MAG: EAL domain-containing protein [Beijerinckiaceae bacterium]|jgi:diguanylate cyclase (GGDEF)-like protein/PAS domain S-box-containing protein|nr:EAL domain-containing protein [Beijerinckiaceae bacterium]
MHRLISKQLDRSRTDDGDIDIEQLIGFVSAAYEEVDRDQARSNRSIRLMAAELEELNATLEQQVIERTQEIEDLKRRFEDAIENLDQGIMMIDRRNKVPVVNQRCIELLDIPGDILRSMPSFDALMHFQHARGEFAPMDETFRKEVLERAHEHTPGVFVRQRPNGVFLEVRTRRLGSGGSIRTYSDVTEREQRTRALAAAEQEYRGLFENSVVGIYRSSLDGRQLRANPSLVRLNGYETEAEMLAAVQDIALEWYVDPARRDEFREALERDGKVTDFVSEIYRHKTREKIWISESAWIVRDNQGKPICYEGTVIDASDRIEADRKIMHMARHDALTEIPNRTFFLESLRKRLRRGRLSSPVAVLCIDLDRFKEVNDTLGHSAGDTLLRSASRRLCSLIGNQDIVARLGGDEFAILLSDPRTDEDIRVITDLILDALSRPFSIGGQRAVIGASIGVAVSGRHGDDPTELLKNADIALYKAKNEGRQRCCFFDPNLTSKLQRRRMIELNLRSALAAGELELHYQPIIDITTGATISHEALLRWRHPLMGLISPAEFIPIAEETGLMIPIGEWILRQACADATGALGSPSIAVNISPVQLRSPNLLSTVMSALASSNLPPERLELEITESVLLSDNKITYGTLRDLKAMGIRIALDDFGTGYSSLSYLQRFQFDKIKIDRSFVAPSQPGTTGLAVVKAVIMMASELGMDVVAEGVETEEQVATLVEAGCRLMQGYLFGRPVPAQRSGQRSDERPVTHLGALTGQGAAMGDPAVREPASRIPTALKRTA